MSPKPATEILRNGCPVRTVACTPAVVLSTVYVKASPSASEPRTGTNSVLPAGTLTSAIASMTGAASRVRGSSISTQPATRGA